MDNQTFQELLDAGELGLILADGGSNLTKEQFEKVKKAASEQSKTKLKQMSQEIANTPGYRDFMLMPIMVSLFGKNQNQPKSIIQNKQIKKEKTKEQKKKDPLFSSVPTGSTDDLKVGDSEADIFAKIYNLMRERNDFTKKKLEDAKRKKEEIGQTKDENYKKLVESLEKGKKTKEKKKSFWKKMLIGSTIFGSLFYSEKSFGKIDKKINELFDFSKFKISTDEDTSSSVGSLNKIKAKEMYDYLTKEKGLSHNEAVAYLANVQAESSFNSAALGDKVNGKYTSGGLLQFHNERFEKMKSFVGKDWQTDWKKQIDYSLQESEFKKFASKDYKTPEEATESFTRIIEKPKEIEKDVKKRLSIVKQIEKTVTNPIQEDTKTKEKNTNVSISAIPENKTVDIPQKMNVKKGNNNVTAVVNNTTNVIQGSKTTNVTQEKVNDEPNIMKVQYR